MDWGDGHYETTAAELAPVADETLAVARVQRGERVLDVGCGTGNAALAAARMGAIAAGVDPAVRLLDVARARAAEQSGDLDLRVGDAVELPWEDGAFDVVVSVFGVVFARPAERAAAELRRVTRPGGRIAYSAWLPAGPIATIGRMAGEALAATTGTPAAPPPAWHEPEVAGGLLGLPVTAVERSLRFSYASAEGLMVAFETEHPFWRTVRATVGEQWPTLRERMLAALAEGNEDPDAYRTTSSYRIVTATT
ncbi:MAG TPA: methyltransferase domain-containing protein [Sporichthyaceae bacterium]|jgi:SAM-dependent methyltransferase